MADVDHDIEQAKASMFRAAARAASALGRSADEAELTARAEDVGRERVTALWREAAAALEDERGAHADTLEDLRYSLASTEAECGRLREQLDAARQALAKITDHSIVSGRGPDEDCGWRCTAELVALARAALGVEGEQEKPT